MLTKRLLHFKKENPQTLDLQKPQKNPSFANLKDPAKRGMDWVSGLAWHNKDGTFKVRRGSALLERLRAVGFRS